MKNIFKRLFNVKGMVVEDVSIDDSPLRDAPVCFVKLKQSKMARRFSPKKRRVSVQLSEKPAAIVSSSIPSGRGFVCTTLPRT